MRLADVQFAQLLSTFGLKADTSAYNWKNAMGFLVMTKRFVSRHKRTHTPAAGSETEGLTGVSSTVSTVSEGSDSP